MYSALDEKELRALVLTTRVEIIQSGKKVYYHKIYFFEI